MASKHFFRSIHSQVQNNSKSISKSRKAPGSDEYVLTEEIKDKGVIILNRAKAMNALNVDMINKMFATIKKWQSTKSMIIVKSNVENVFSAGGDVAAAVEADSPEYGKSIFRNGYALNHLISKSPIPHVSLIASGVTIGGGVGISVHGKYRIASEKTVFAMPEASIGLFPDSGVTHVFPRLQGKLGYYLGLTGQRLKGEDVLHAKIATHFCESAKIPELENALLNLKNTSDTESVINEICSRPKTEFTLTKHLDQINKHFTASSIEEILSSLEQDDSKWAKQTIKTMQRMPPTSLKVTLRALDLGSKLSLSDALKMEYRIASRMIQSSNFHNGVRALLIVKDNRPTWHPARIEDVDDGHISSLFEPLPNNEDISL